MNNIHFSHKTNEWSTPDNLFNDLNQEFHFTLDPCATPQNAKCEKYYTKEKNGLIQDWIGERVFMNPPYGKAIGKWIEKAVTESSEVVVMLLPARTDTRWFHTHIYGSCTIRFLKGRLTFGNAKHPAPFPSMVVIKNNIKNVN